MSGIVYKRDGSVLQDRVERAVDTGDGHVMTVDSGGTTRYIPKSEIQRISYVRVEVAPNSNQKNRK